MNKRGVTILELLISMVLISIIILMLIKVMFSLENINNDKSYASDDEITRTEIIKNIESDFLKLKLNGLQIEEKDDEIIINFIFLNTTKDLVIKSDSLTYDNRAYTLKSSNASYNKCLEYKFRNLDNGYYYMELNIPVLIDKENTTKNDDITLTFLGLADHDTSYIENYNCSTK